MEVTPRRKFGWGKAVRLRKHAQFSRVQSKGRRMGGKFLIVIFAPSSFLGIRFGLTVSKRVGCAVTRNRIKRRLRDILRQNKDALAPMHVDVVCIAKQDAANASYHALKQDILDIFQRASRSRL